MTVQHTFSSTNLLGSLLVLGLTFSLPSTSHAQDQPGTWDKMKQGVGSVFETKQEKYRRQQQEQDEIERKRRLQEDLSRQQEELRRIEEEKRRLQQLGAPISRQPRSSRPNNDVEVFVASNCDDCLKVVGFLDGANVVYRVYNLETNKQAEQEYFSTIGRGVIPAIRFRGVVLRGYDPSQLRRMFAQQGKREAAKISPVTQPPPQPAAAPVQPPKEEAAPSEEADPTLPPAAGSNENQFDISTTLPQNEEAEAN